MSATEVMFIGRALHAVDGKNRCTVPQGMRDISTTGEETKTWKAGIITVSPNMDCLHLYEKKAWKKLMAAVIGNQRLLDPETSRFLRIVGGNAQNVECDGMFRIVIPTDLRALVGIEDQARWVGATHFAEIWNPERWDEYISQHQGEFPDLWATMSSRVHDSTFVEEVNEVVAVNAEETQEPA